MKFQMTSFDVTTIVKYFNDNLLDSRINNIYDVSNSEVKS